MFNNKDSYIENKKIFYVFFLFLFLFFLFNFYISKNSSSKRELSNSSIFKKEEFFSFKKFNNFFLKSKKFIYNENFIFLNIDSNLNTYSHYIEFSNIGAKINKFFLISKYNNVPLINSNDENSCFFSLKAKEIDEHEIYKEEYSENNILNYILITKNNIKIEKKFFFNNENFILDNQMIFTNLSNNNKIFDFDYLFNFINYEYYKKNIFSDNKEIVFFYDSFDKKKNVENLNDLNNFFFNNNFKFFGFNEKFFLFLLFNKNVNLDFNSISAKVFGNKKTICLSKKNLEISKDIPQIIFLNSFFGFKNTGNIAQINSNFSNFIDYGIFEIFSKTLLFFLFKINGFFNNLGLSIIILTFLIKLITYPLTKKSMESMKKMKEISSDIKYLQDKYSEDKNVLSQKQMELYKEKGIYPWTGCLPTLIQIPLWISLYQALLNSVDFFRESFLWLDDLTLPDNYFILPFFSFFSSIFQTLSQPQTDNNKNILSNYLLYIMPFVILYFTFILPSGLSLFIIFNSFITFIHQVILKKK